MELARRLAENGSDGVYQAPRGKPHLKFEEKVKLFSEVTDALGGQVEIIAGTDPTQPTTALP